MQSKYGFCELHGINGTIGAAPIVLDNLGHPALPNPLSTFAASC